MDNRSIDVSNEGSEKFAMAMNLIWPHANTKATHYKIARIERKITYYLRKPGVHPGPFGGNCDIPNCNLDDIQFVASHYSTDEIVPGKPNTLILLAYEENDALKLPYPLNLKQTTEFGLGWLDEVEYDDQPDHDGSNGKGWRLFTNYWGHVANYHSAIVGIQPIWAMYGK